MSSSTEIQISQSAIRNNIGFLKEVLGDKVKISSVIKANAYGHGIEIFAKEVENNGINHFAVFSYLEAIRARKVLSDSSDIMIKGWIDNEDLEDAIIQGFEFYVFDLEKLKCAIKLSAKLNMKAKIHIEVETGLNRTGLNAKEFNKTIKLIQANEGALVIKGICSHLAGPESIANHVRVKKQINTFKSRIRKLTNNSIFPEYKHIACSAGAFSYPEARFNMVRIGIMQYGYWSSKETYLRFIHNKKNIVDPLKRVICWKTKIMSIKKVKTGDFISYGTTYLAQDDMKIGIIPIGYSNGYSRSLSNNGRVLINGVRCGIIGLVNMNMIIANLTNLDDAKIGDEVIIVGTQNDLSISVDSFSEISQQVNYEILSRIPLDIHRKLVE
ncbi:MAG: alanine racemase [Candidatus Zophobacter franzmannii]|nr:alanine racemase [Candidatus Zophobacter franzmannii]